MSYVPTRNYPHHILRPIRCDTQRINAKDDRMHPRPPTTSPLWTATTHTYVGTLDRDSHPAWPPAEFDKDPSHIQDNPIHNIQYNSASAKKHTPDFKHGVYHMFSTSCPTDPNSACRVPPPKIVVKRYTPNDLDEAPRDITRAKLTLLVLPGMNSPKELLEPIIEGIITHQPNTIAEIWTVDMPMSGETALINPLGYLYGNEKDVARDLLLFVTLYLPLQSCRDLPTELVPRSPTGASPQQTRQHLHVIGHSLGAQSAILMAVHAPSLFESLTVIDPAMIPTGKILEAFTALPKDALCTGFRYEYASRDAFEADVRTNKRTRGWDERIIRKFVERGIMDNGDGSIRLVSHPRLEWALYYDQETPAQCYDRLVDLEVPLNAIMPTRPFAVHPKMFQDDVAKLKQRKQVAWIPKATHQLPFEKVDECVALTSKWLGSFHPNTQTAKL